MLLQRLALAGLLAACAAGTWAQDLRGPREMPPAGFTGQQYVDSAGCVFLRAGVAGRLNWVPRVSRDRRQICGQVPSFTPEPTVTAAAEPAPPPRRRAGDPIDTIASTTAPPAIREPAPRSRVPAASYAPPPVVAPRAPAPAPRVETSTPGCPAHAPHGERMALDDGRTALVCARTRAEIPAAARRAGSPARTEPAPPRVARAETSPATAPVMPRQAGEGRLACPASSPYLRAFALEGGGRTWLCSDGQGGALRASWRAGSGQTFVPTAWRGRAVAHGPRATGGHDYAVAGTAVPIPPGYRAAWTDDRLNPRRAVGTPEGQAAQDRLWTREVPARRVAEAPAPTRRVVVSSSGAARAPQAPATAAAGRFYVQVGSFAVAENAARSRARLAGLGLPVATGQGSIKGKPVQVVKAGPFATEAQARAALAAARGAGFADAFVK